jgi:putative ABC transport system permease protein
MFGHYVAIALRNVRSARIATAVNVLTLAIGLVCFVTAYAFVTFWGAAERQFRNADDVHVLTITIRNRQSGAGMDSGTTVPEIAAETLRSDFPAITKIARANIIDRQTIVASGGRAARLFGVAVDPEFLEIFDLPFVAGDARSAFAAPRSAVLTRDAAAKLFGSEDPLGKSILIHNAIDATVTGVIDAISEPSHMGRSAQAPLPFDLLASRDVIEALRGVSGRFNGLGANGFLTGAEWFRINAIVYLYLPAAGGLSADALAAQLEDFVARHVPAESVRSQDEYSLGLVPVRKLLSGTTDFLGTGLPFAAVLLLLAGLVLGVACVNYANLATARAVRRVREIGVRKALGASPRQIAVQSLLEAAAMVLAALVVAVAAFALAQPLVKRLLGAEIGSSFFTSLEVWPALGALVVGVTLAAGAYPAFVLSRVRPVSAIATARARLGSPRFSTLLVGTQFGVASFLLIAVTVISMQNADLRRTALSALEDPLVVIENASTTTKVEDATLRERLAALPQVRGVTGIGEVPWQSLRSTTLRESSDPASPQRSVVNRGVGFDFFDVFDVPLVAGRVFDLDHAEDQSRPPAPQNIVVDRQLVATFGLGTPEEALGKLVYQSAPPTAPQPPPMRIIGVVEDRSFSFLNLPANTAGVVYTVWTSLSFTVARVRAADLDAGLEGIDATWKQLAPNVAISRRFLDQIFERSYAQYLRINQLFGALAAMAFAICVAGLFGMATFVAGRRRHEIGVRKTLGGSSGQMIALLLGSFSKPVLIANLIAWPAGYFAARAYLNQFSDSIALTPWPFVLSIAITLAIAWVSVLGQTLRAARTTPAEVLRNE